MAFKENTLALKLDRGKRKKSIRTMVGSLMKMYTVALALFKAAEA